MPSKLRLGITFLLFDGFSNMVLASAIEPLRVARDMSRDGSAFSWRLATLEGRSVRSSSGLEVQPDHTVADATVGDWLLLVSGYGARRHATPTTIDLIQRVARSVGFVGGLDTGAWILGEAGLLGGYRATIHWQELREFEESFLDVEVSGDHFVIDRNRITAGGASTVMRLMLHLIRSVGGSALAFDVSNMFVYDVERSFSKDRGARSQAVIRAPQLEAAILEMRRTVEDPLPIAQIASAASISPRTMDRLFQTELATSPGRYYQMVRLNVARMLAVETNLSTTEIAVKSGFTSSATLSRAFSRLYGQTIRSIRKHRKH